MNFHKTIGFLAALLLTLGLGVPDSFAQNVSKVELTASPNAFMDTDDETQVILTATVTLVSAATAQVNQSVVIDVETGHADHTAESGDYSDISGNFTVEISQGATSGSAQFIVAFDPAVDDNDTEDEVVVVEAATGGETGIAKITIADTDNGVKSLTLSATKTRFNDTDNATAVTLTATVIMDRAVMDNPDTEGTTADAVTVAVAISDGTPTSGDDLDPDVHAESGDYTLSGVGTVNVVIPVGSNRASVNHIVSFNPNTDDTDTDDEKVLIAGRTTYRGTTVPPTDDDPATVEMTISDSDIDITNIAIELDPATLMEDADETTVTLTVTVTMEGNVAAATTFQVDLEDDDAHDDHTAETGDYNAITIPTVNVEIAANKRTGTATTVFLVTPQADTDDNEDEVVIITGSTTISGSDRMGSAGLTIIDAGVGVTGLSLSLNPSSVDESDNNRAVIVKATVTLEDAATAARDVNVNVMLNPDEDAGHTAEAGDFVSSDLLDGDGDPIVISIVVPIAQGASTGSADAAFNIAPVADEDADTEMVAIAGQVVDANGNETNVTAVALLTINDTPGSIIIELATDSVGEGDGATDVGVTVTLDPAAATDVVVTASIDGVAHSSTIVSVLASGTGTGTLTITPIDDAIDGGGVTVTVNAAAEGYDSPDAETITIKDDDIPNTLTFEVKTPRLTEEGGEQTVDVDVTLTPAPAAATDVTVTANLGGGHHKNGGC